MSIYRSNSYLRIFGSIIKLVIQISLWKALLSSGINTHHISFQDLLIYIFINTIILPFTESNMANHLGNKIKDGTIAIDLLRPVSLKLYLFSEELGENLYKTFFNILPICIIFMFITKITIFPGSMYLFLFVISIINGIIISYYINYIIGLTVFWLQEFWYIYFFQVSFFTLFGATAVPLWFYPGVLLQISNILPFKYAIFEPVNIYLEKISFHQSIMVIVVQVVWLIILVVLSFLIWEKAKKKVIIQGG
ncbi:MAG: ABC-2 family transporter protein [Spirochaetales bacterium]|nr:ABC-2 family transporter protein [Spirochaetales bacterium]